MPNWQPNLSASILLERVWIKTWLLRVHANIVQYFQKQMCETGDDVTLNSARTRQPLLVAYIQSTLWHLCFPEGSHRHSNTPCYCSDVDTKVDTFNSFFFWHKEWLQTAEAEIRKRRSLSVLSKHGDESDVKSFELLVLIMMSKFRMMLTED